MSVPENKEFKKIQFYLTANYNCGYLPEKKAQSIVASPYQDVNQNEFDNLITIGLEEVEITSISPTVIIVRLALLFDWTFINSNEIDLRKDVLRKII
jgi:hypothetical protein